MPITAWIRLLDKGAKFARLASGGRRYGPPASSLQKHILNRLVKLTLDKCSEYQRRKSTNVCDQRRARQDGTATETQKVIVNGGQYPMVMIVSTM